MIRAGEGIVINYDGGGAEIASSTAQWFVAEITGTVSATTPVNHKWKKKVPKKDGKSFEDANPPVIGNGTANPAYLPALATGDTSTATATGLVFMRLRSTNDDGQCVYEIIGSAWAAAGGTSTTNNATIEVVTDVVCTPTGIEVSTVTLSGKDYDNAVIRQFLALSDVTPSSYLGNQGRVVKVNDAATALEFGAIGEGPTGTTFIALTDTPATYGSNAYKALTVSSTNDGIAFSSNNVTTTNSLSGGGNPSSPSFVALKLLNDTGSPGNYKFYATTSAGVKGWQDLTLKCATDFPASYSGAGGKFLKVNSGATAVEFVTLDITGMAASIAALTTTTNALSAALASLTARVAALEGA